MLPEEVFKRRRRHNNTPESTLLIIANFIVISASITLFTDHKHINWFFWVVVFLLGVYNFFTIRRNIEEFSGKIVLIAYSTSLVVLIALFFILRH